MKYLTLNNGIEMPVLGYGTWEVRGKAGLRALHYAIEAGYRLIDTAHMYENEDIVGEAVQQSGLSRSEFFITTKLDSRSNSYDKACRGIELSLRNLQCDYIDLMLIHENYSNSDQMYKALREALNNGMVRSIGISNFREEAYLSFIERCGIIPAVNQMESHIYHAQLGYKQLLARHGTVFQSWSPFTSGERKVFDEPLLKQIALRYDSTPAQIVLAYLISQGIAVIPRTLNPEHMIKNMLSLELKLSHDDIEAIKTLDEGKSLFSWY
ncbi:aldo/keto reductase [Anaerobiospirillum sp. NML120449]|uniref:aldo/keto reductase n=1 Tax=Anaerobiospirillum sp. NML120449 TaxID=2932817 RepID=UPI001FF6C17A|nr:aldo/keto reductase [Anaerobiospirillum sp. NML120449]MCK0525791.1 aldo/keto reductase [Anaerobiospirillum sp. NML120449]